MVAIMLEDVRKRMMMSRSQSHRHCLMDASGEDRRRVQSGGSSKRLIRSTHGDEQDGGSGTLFFGNTIHNSLVLSKKGTDVNNNGGARLQLHRRALSLGGERKLLLKQKEEKKSAMEARQRTVEAVIQDPELFRELQVKLRRGRAGMLRRQQGSRNLVDSDGSSIQGDKSWTHQSVLLCLPELLEKSGEEILMMQKQRQEEPEKQTANRSMQKEFVIVPKEQLKRGLWGSQRAKSTRFNAGVTKEGSVNTMERHRRSVSLMSSFACTKTPAAGADGLSMMAPETIKKSLQSRNDGQNIKSMNTFQKTSAPVGPSIFRLKQLFVRNSGTVRPSQGSTSHLESIFLDKQQHNLAPCLFSKHYEMTSHNSGDNKQMKLREDDASRNDCAATAA